MQFLINYLFLNRNTSKLLISRVELSDENITNSNNNYYLLYISDKDSLYF